MGEMEEGGATQKGTAYCVQGAAARMKWTFLRIKQEVLGRTDSLLSFHYILNILYNMDRTENTASSSSSIACAFFTVGTCLPSCCVAPIGGIHRQQASIYICFQNKESRLKM
jgi:hypothetical protein